ncbi:MAG: esterase-like activity of phytase family protein, partial [Prevotella sp.]|nr:esterase-like activity of phytase family protein [Prevotella sp.]
RCDGKASSPQNPRRNVLRLMSFSRDDVSAAPVSYLYRMDMPTTLKSAQTYAMGVSELCALPDGQLLVLEREAFVPKAKMGAFCQCKLYIVNPSVEKPYPLDRSVEADAPYVGKRLLTSWRTTISLFSQNWANYEGMCLGPKLDNGDQVVVLVSDSQDGYAGVLRDWFKTIVISN